MPIKKLTKSTGKLFKDAYVDLKGSADYYVFKKHPVIGKYKSIKSIKSGSYRLKIIRFEDHIRIEGFERIRGYSKNLDPSLRKLSENIHLVKEYAKKNDLNKIIINSSVFLNHPNFAKSLGFKVASNSKLASFKNFVKQNNIKKILQVYFEGNKCFMEYLDKSLNLYTFNKKDIKKIEVNYRKLPEYEIII